MTIIRFPNAESKRRALGWLLGRFSFRSWKTGEIMVPEDALPALALAGFRFHTEGPANYEQFVPPLQVHRPGSA